MASMKRYFFSVHFSDLKNSSLNYTCPVSSPSENTPRDYNLWVARALLGEAVIICLIALYLATAPLYSHTTHPLALLGEILFCALGAGGLAFSAKAFKNHSLLGRGPALLANGIALGVSYFMDRGKFWGVGAPLGLYSLTVLVLIALSGKITNAEN
jgi:hypothetical protein